MKHENKNFEGEKLQKLVSADLTELCKHWSESGIFINKEVLIIRPLHENKTN